jgi:HEAT repeat protein
MVDKAIEQWRNDPQDDWKAKATAAAAVLAPHENEAIAELFQRAVAGWQPENTQEQQDVGTAAQAVLGAMGAPAVVYLEERLDDESMWVRLVAADQLAVMYREADAAEKLPSLTPVFVELLERSSHRDDKERVLVLLGMDSFVSNRGAGSAAEPLVAPIVEAMQDESTMLQRTAIRLLANIGPEAAEAIEPLRRLAADTSEPTIRQRAHQAIEDIKTR